MNREYENTNTIVENARRLLDGRKKAGIARQAGIERTKLYRFLNGKQVLRADELQSLADVLGVEVTEFYGKATLKPDFQSAFMKNDDFALRISSLLLGSDERVPIKDTGPLDAILADVEADPEAERIVTDLCDVLRSPSLSAFAFIGAWVLLWDHSTVDEAITIAKGLRRSVPPHEERLIKAGTVYYRNDVKELAGLRDLLVDVNVEPAYARAFEHLRYVLSMGMIDQCANLAHKVLDKHRRRSQESVHNRLLTVKRTIDRSDAQEFWGKLLTYLDPNVA